MGYNAGSTGSYTLNGGWLSTPYENVGLSGSGYCNQLAGTNAVTNNLNMGFYAGSSGSYSLVAGLASAFELNVGVYGSGSFTQTAGTNSLAEYLVLAYESTSSGTYTLRGGSLAVPSEYIGLSGSGTFTQSGGTNSAGALYLGYYAGSSGVYNLNGGMLAVAGSASWSGSNALDIGGGTLAAGAGWLSSIPLTLTGSGGNATVDTTGGSISLCGVFERSRRPDQGRRGQFGPHWFRQYVRGRNHRARWQVDRRQSRGIARRIELDRRQRLGVRAHRTACRAAVCFTDRFANARTGTGNADAAGGSGRGGLGRAAHRRTVRQFGGFWWSKSGGSVTLETGLGGLRRQSDALEVLAPRPVRGLKGVQSSLRDEPGVRGIQSVG